MSVILMTHDLGIVAQTCDRVAVMYAGKIAETRRHPDAVRASASPYTAALLALAAAGAIGAVSRCSVIPGAPPDLAAPPPGCRFHPRCPFADRPLPAGADRLEARRCAARFPPVFEGDVLA